MSQELLRHLPAVDEFLKRAGVQPLIAQQGRAAVRDAVRAVLDELRRTLLSGAPVAPPDNSDNHNHGAAVQLAQLVETRLHARFAQRANLQTQRVINATGVVLHTNLGRAPLSEAALQAIHEVAAGYSNLEFDIATGKRGKRGTGLEAQLRELLGCEAVAIVNNCAAAVFLTLNTLAAGGEVIIARGELVEIGGSFRIPDVIAKSGARLREVGTTNRTRLRDYEAALNEQTKVILRVHPSNYRIIGFTEKPALGELAQLARAHGIPCVEDLGSGALVDLQALGVREEPTLADSLRAGVPVVAFSGDKLLGGPQAGIIIGEQQYIRAIKANPLMRALRVDKLTYAALEATVAAYLRGDALTTIPVLRALHSSQTAIAQRAQAFVAQAAQANLTTAFDWQLRAGVSMVGGGSAPEQPLPTTLIAVSSAHWTAAQLEEWLRTRQQPSIVARIQENELVLDLRTVAPNEEALLLRAFAALAQTQQL